MKEPKLTPWFPGHIKPSRPGVYQQYSGLGGIGYQLWDGLAWRLWERTPQAAAASFVQVASAYQNDQWRGLSEKP